MKMKFYQKGATLGFISAVFLFISLLGIKTPISLAKEVKPGVVITDKNYKEFPELKKLLPDTLYRRFDPNSIDQLTRIEVVPTQKLQKTKEEREWNAKNEKLAKEGKLYYDADKDWLVGWQAGIPFPHPKNDIELGWDFTMRRWAGDRFVFHPCGYVIWDKKLQRKEVFVDPLCYKRYSGRCEIPPIPSDPKRPDLYDKVSILAQAPYDMAGYCLVRVRYNDPIKEDDSWIYIPAIRRVRRMVAADYQDPQFGSDNTLDDYATYYMKPGGHRVKFKKIGEGNFLVYSPHKGFFPGSKKMKTIKKREFFYPYEIRPCYVLQMDILDKTYMYSKRIYWFDKETWLHYYSEFYDQQGKLWRTHQVGWWYDDKGGFCWCNSIINDWITGSKTCIFTDVPQYNHPWPDNEDWYDMGKLRLTHR